MLYKKHLIPMIIFAVTFILSGCVGTKYSDTIVAEDLKNIDNREAKVTVLAKAAEWRNSGALVRKGQKYNINAEGRWRVGGVCGWTAPDGIGCYGPICWDLGDAVVKGWSHSTLIGKIGESGQPFGIGSRYELKAEDDGILFLKINDPSALSGDNEGHCLVTTSLIEELKSTTPASSAVPQSTAPLAKTDAGKEEIRKVSSSERRIALVVGNGDYTSSPLRNTVNDANDMSYLLEQCGFTVLKAINADRRGLRMAVQEFGDEIKRGGIGLFYYAGHGLQVEGENFLVPIGAQVEREYQVEDECLKVSSVLRAMENASNHLNIIILDACRDNPFSRSFRSGTRGLAKMDAPAGSLLAYATSPGSVASDGDGRNGLYTSMLLRHMRTPGQNLIDMFIKVRNDVANSSSEKQIPWETQSIREHFYFVPALTED